MEDRNKRLDKLMRDYMYTENPPSDFSDKVMQQIVSSEKEKEKVLGLLMQKHAMESPSINFTHHVMDKIQVKEPYVFIYKPVISKKNWLMISVFLLLVVIFSFLSMDYQEDQLDYIGKFMIKLDSIISFQLPEVIFSPILALSLFTMSLFLWIDYFIQNRYKSHSSNVI